MPKSFNTAGPCLREDHYMLPATSRLEPLRPYFDQKQYIVLHAPRQSGKSTCILSLVEELNAEGRYVALRATCEEGQPFRNDPIGANQSIIENILYWSDRLPEDLRPPPMTPYIESPTGLRNFLADWAQRSPKPIVLFLDEIDALQDDALLGVLRQLRAGYERRPTHFPQSVCLIGLRDVRDYKVKSGAEGRLTGPSPFNIKVRSLTLKNFTRDEVGALYAQHTEATGQVFTPEAVDRAYYYTKGQPWLVNALARELIDEMKLDRTLLAEDIEIAKERLILSRATHLDSLLEKLKEARVQRVIEPMLTGGMISADLPLDDLEYCQDLGLIVRGMGLLTDIANPIYREVIPRALNSVAAEAIAPPQRSWSLPDGKLDIDGLMKSFVEFWTTHAEILVRRQPYPEAAPHLILMAFFQRLLNGGGRIEREYALGMGRLDLLLRWPIRGSWASEDRHAIELKIWHDKKRDPLAQGLLQLEEYLIRLGLDRGTLLIFDRRSQSAEIEWEDRLREESAQTAGGRAVRVIRL